MDGSKMFCSHLHMFCYYITHKVDLSLRRARTQANLDERGFFKRGQKKLAKKRGKGSGSGGSGKKKKKKKAVAPAVGGSGAHSGTRTAVHVPYEHVTRLQYNTAVPMIHCKP